MKTCEQCFFWSQRIAEATGTGAIRAMCLNDGSEKCGKMTAENQSCEQFKEGNGRSVDLP